MNRRRPIVLHRSTTRHTRFAPKNPPALRLAPRREDFMGLRGLSPLASAASSQSFFRSRNRSSAMPLLLD